MRILQHRRGNHLLNALREVRLHLILALALAAPPATPVLTLRLSAARPRTFVGEAQKLLLSWHAQRPVEIHPESVNLMLDAGGGYRPYRDTAIAICTSWHLGELILKPGDPYRTSYVMAVEGQLLTTGEKDFQFAFPKPGAYRVRAEYKTLVSNEVSITVTEPRGRDGDLFRKVLLRRPELLTEWAFEPTFGEPSDLEEIGRLVREHEGSPYVHRIGQLYGWRRLQDAFRARGRWGPPLSEEERALLQEVEVEVTSDDPFYAERLLAAAKTRQGWGDPEGAARTYRKLLSGQPDTEVAAEARSWLAGHRK